MNKPATIAVPTTFDLPALRAAMRTLSMVPERLNTIPVLACVKIQAGAPLGTVLTVTNLDFELEFTLMPGNVDEAAPFTIAVDAMALAKALAAIPGETVALSVNPNGNRLLVQADGFEAELVAPSTADTFPHMALKTGGTALTLSAARLAGDWAAVAPAASTEDTRYYLNGTCLAKYEGKPHWVATDGHRLFAVEAEDAVAWPDTLPIVHTTTMRLARAVIAAADEQTVEAAFYPGRLQIIAGRWRIASKLIDGTYPDFGRVIPKHGPLIGDNEKRARLHFAAKAFAAAAKAATAFNTAAKSSSRSVKVLAGPRGITLSHKAPEAGVARANVVGSSVEGLDFPIGFNGRYLADMAAFFGAAKVTVTADDCAAPSLWRSPELAGRLAVLMPMRVDDRD